MVIGDLLDSGTKRLEENGIGDSYSEALILLTYTLECSRTYIYVNKKQEVNAVTASRFLEYTKRRAGGEPVAYILGKAWFMSLEFMVTPAVLIPRPETEGLVEEAALILKNEYFQKARVLDLCTGSGCIGISIATMFCDAMVDLSDIDVNALDVASYNIIRHSLNERVKVFRSDLFGDLAGRRYDLIVSNPPYVSDGDTRHLSLDVSMHEPGIALYAGADGLDFYRRIASEAGMHLNPGGYLVLEAGIGQADDIAGILSNNGLTVTGIKNDLAGIPRVVTSKK